MNARGTGIFPLISMTIIVRIRSIYELILKYQLSKNDCNTIFNGFCPKLHFVTLAYHVNNDNGCLKRQEINLKTLENAPHQC